MRKTITYSDKEFDFENALINALPPFRDSDDYHSDFNNLPVIDISKRQKSKAERIDCLRTLNKVRISNPFGYRVDSEVASAIRKGYDLSVRKEGAPTAYLDPQSHSFYSKVDGDSSAFFLHGPSGVGKTTTLCSSLSYYPQMIMHEAGFRMIQIPYIKVECPPGGSIKTFYDSFLDALEDASDYRILDRNRCTTADAKALICKKYALRWNLGLIVIDEIQNLVFSKSNLLMRQFLTLSNELHIPIIYCGTDAAVEIFQNSEFFMKRRLGTVISARPYQKNLVWDDFLKKIWEFQWMKEYVPLTEELNAAIFLSTGGLVERVISLFGKAQKEAILEEKDTVEGFTSQFIINVSKEYFSLTHNSMTALADSEHSLQKLSEKDLRLAVEKQNNPEFSQKKELLDVSVQKKKESKKEILRSNVFINIKETSKYLPYSFETEQIEKAFQRYYKNYRNKSDDENAATKKVLELLIEEKLNVPVKLDSHLAKKQTTSELMGLPVMEGVI